MSMHERSGQRDLTYSRWHRPASLSRFVGPRAAALAKVCDIDWCEACNFCSQPVALIETQAGDRPPKPATITTRLAVLAGVPAFSVSYVTDGDDITSFLLRCLTTPGSVTARVTPQQYGRWLLQLRDDHYSRSPGCAAAATKACRIDGRVREVWA